jgi:hypothetical protein
MRILSPYAPVLKLCMYRLPPLDIQQLFDLLNRNFGNLPGLFQDESPASCESLLQPVLDRFIDALAEVSRRHPELTPKCEDLTLQLNRFRLEGSP